MQNEYLEPLWEALGKYAEYPAVVDKGAARSTTYAEFSVMIRRVMAWLDAKELKDPVFIPIVMESSAEYLASEIGIWFSGHTAVPMGTAFPQERIDYICEHCESPFVIDAAAWDEIATTEPREFTEQESPDFPSEDLPALLIYTSGSTGNPKGILHTFGGLAVKHTSKVGLVYTTEDRWGMGAPLYFVASLTSFKALKEGAALHLYDSDTYHNIPKLEDYIEEHRITYTFLSPAMLPNFHNRSDSLKLVFTGSERLTNQCSRDGYKLMNCYGMSETGGTVTAFAVDQEYDTTPVGHPEEKWALLDEDGNPVEKGEEGEFCLSGHYCAGYYKDPEKTEELYRGGWLHTGDILRELPDGNLVYVNRKDWMAKINGQRVEPGEVENAIKKLPGVTGAVVKAFENDTGSQYLCAFYTGDADGDALREVLAATLPPYMVPSYFVPVLKFALLPNGKVNRKVLAAPDISSLQSSYTAPENDAQKAICDAFAEIFGLDQVGIDDDFFLLGGDSIRVMKLQQLCPDLMLSAKAISAARTPRKIAESAQPGQATQQERTEASPTPLSQTQMGIYVESVSREGEAVYNNPVLLELDRSIDEGKLAHAIEQMVEAHSFVKCHIEDSDGTPMMVPGDWAFSCVPLRMSDKEFETHKAELIQPFDLHAGPLFRFEVIRTDSSLFLFFDFHHVIFDGTSMRIMMSDIDTAYAGGQVKAEAYTGFDIAADEAQARAADEYDQAKSWHEETFVGLDLDSQPKPDASGEEPTFALYEKELGVDVDAWKRFCQRAGVTENVFSIAAFGQLLGAYSNSREALFATIYNGRADMRSARTIDMMVKTLPIHCKWDASTRVVDYLSAVKEHVRLNMEHDVFSFAEVASIADVTSDVLFAYQGDYLTLGEVCGHPFKRVELGGNATGSPLDFQLFAADGDLQMRTEYRSDLYSQAFIEDMVACYANIVREMMFCERLCDIEFVDKGMLELLDTFNGTESDYDKTQTVVSLFRAAASKYPQNIAVIFEDENMTYAELDDVTDRLAMQIRDMGASEPNDVVSILIPRGLLMPVTALGALKAGCAYQPLDPTYPPERLNFMAEDAAAKVLVTTSGLANVITDFPGKVIVLDSPADVPDCDVSELGAGPSPDDLLILLYTSGTTGLPKGVRLLERNLVCFINWYTRFFGMDATSVSGAYASFGFDACMMDMFPALSRGASVAIVPEEMRLDLVGIDEYFTKNNVTHAFMTTQVGRQFAMDATCPSLKFLPMGGETLIPFDAQTHFACYNVYGPTECTILSTYYAIQGGEDNYPIGRLLDNFKGYVVSLDGKRLPIGAEGELWLAGTQIGAGYLNRPDKTEEAFGSNPFASGDYAPLYRTGDIVKWRRDGMLDFVGRRDGQVKVRGFRIELAEVEAVVRDFPGVKDATIAAFDHPAGGKFVAAYIVADEEISPDKLGDFIREQKPPYMVPAAIMQIDKIPLNQNGKVNRRALPEPVLAEGPEEEAEATRPLNALEEKLKEIISSVIGTDAFGALSPLSRYGLTSILRIKLLTSIYKRLGVSIKAKDLDEITLTALENAILHSWMAGETADVKSAESPREFRAPLTFAQMGVYYECLKHPTSLAYNIPSIIRFDKSVSCDDVAAALEKTVRAHPTLSSRFTKSGEDVALVLSDATPEIARVELVEAELNKYAQRFVKPFDLEGGSLCRFAIADVDGSAPALLCDFHHLAFDGASMGVFLADLAQALGGTEIESEAYTYSDYAQAQASFAASAGFEQNAAYFADALSDFESATELPADKTGKESAGKHRTASTALDMASVEDYAANYGVTPAAVMLAATAYAVSRYANERNVYLSTISNGRANVEYASTVGMFVNTLPLACHVADVSAKEFIERCAQTLEGAIAHEEYPFARIAADYGFAPQTVYEYQLGAVDAQALEGGAISSVEGIASDAAKFKLAIHIEMEDGAPSIVCHYNDALYSADLMEGLAHSIAIVASKLINDPDAPVRKISMVDAARAEELERFHETETGPLDFETYHAGLERQADSIPEQAALIATDATYTFSELDRAANRIANALIRRGVKTGDRIAILLGRDSRVIISMFGIMKAGAAYIPCDPSYPTERVNHILTDSQAPIVITTKERLDSYGNAVDVDELLACEDASRPDVEVSPDDLAYMIYTSGSTGKPKGVMLTHRGVCSFHSNHPSNILVDALVRKAHRFLTVTTLSFDMSVKEVGTPLVNGLSIVLADEQQVNDPGSLAKLFAETGADAFNATHSRLKQYLEHPAFAEAIGACHVVLSGGEKYTEGLLPLLHKITNATIINTYGPTETTVSSNMKDLTHTNRITVGRPLYNVWETIVDADGNELPRGVVGELLIAGNGVGIGYHNLPDKTAEAFIEYEGRRAYRSGDYARWTEDGDVEILGRTDNQVKLRGLRIEIGEVESALSAVEGVKSSAVKIAAINGVEHLCAYYVANAPIDPANVKAAMGETLAKYMVPTAYLQLEKLPLTPNGKVDYKNLPAATLLSTSAGVEAENAVEAGFCSIFQNILGIDNVGATDDFFEIGGTSLMAIRITVEAEKLGYTITYSDVFANPTPRMLAALVGEESGGGTEDVRNPEVDDYDYTAIDEVLAANTLKGFIEGNRRPLGNVLLTGAAGYLGIHVLHEFLENYSGEVYCLLRGKGGIDAQTRLKHQLFYYFETSYSPLFGNRIHIVEGDVTKDIALPDGARVDTVINCAAVVKHFSAGTEIEDVNVGGVVNLISFCRKRGIPLIQISTGSTMKCALKPGFDIMGRTNERQHYLGQDLANKYVRSKFLSERALFAAVAEGGFAGKVIRVGNLAPRTTDGEFQINYGTNSAMGRLKSFALLGCASYDQLDSTMEFSPIDETARAILLLAQTPESCVAFHAFNHHETYLGDVFAAMGLCGLDIEPVEREEFVRRLKEAEQDEEKAQTLTSLVAYARKPTGKPVVIPKVGNAYTMQVLYRMGFRWTPTSTDYVERFIEALEGLGFFDEDVD